MFTVYPDPYLILIYNTTFQICPDYDSCASNRTGRLCGRCEPGTSELLNSAKCIPDSECHDSWYLVIDFLFAVLITAFFMYTDEVHFRFSHILKNYMYDILLADNKGCQSFLYLEVPIKKCSFKFSLFEKAILGQGVCVRYNHVTGTIGGLFMKLLFLHNRGPILKRQLTNMRLMYLWDSQTPCPNIAFLNKLNLNEHFFISFP